MKVLSIDPGLKNLAFCLLDSDNILLWDAVDVFSPSTRNTTCGNVMKNGQVCKRTNCGIHSKKIKTTLRSKTLQDIVYAVNMKLNHLISTNEDVLKDLDTVLIELQPRINNKMKLVSHVIFSKFAERFHTSKVRFVTAVSKLRDQPKQCKTTYAQRKKLAIACSKEILASGNGNFQQWSQVWLQNKTSIADMADAFLYSYNAVRCSK